MTSLVKKFVAAAAVCGTLAAVPAFAGRYTGINHNLPSGGTTTTTSSSSTGVGIGLGGSALNINNIDAGAYVNNSATALSSSTTSTSVRPTTQPSQGHQPGRPGPR